LQKIHGYLLNTNLIRKTPGLPVTIPTYHINVSKHGRELRGCTGEGFEHRIHRARDVSRLEPLVCFYFNLFIFTDYYDSRIHYKPPPPHYGMKMAQTTVYIVIWVVGKFFMLFFMLILFTNNIL
jgi:hypothetical protein